MHQKIKDIISDYLAQADHYLPNLVEGFYIYGSIALGNYSLELSDIDFITVTSRRLNHKEIEVFDKIHKKVRGQISKPNLSGIYVTWEDLGKLKQDISPFPFYNGKMNQSGYFELNLVTWYELIHHGIAIRGPLTKDLSLTVDWSLLIENMQKNLNTYWVNWIKKSRGVSINSLILYFRRTDIEWGVLGISRLYYTFKENEITTKKAAGEYALRVVSKKWHKIIQESINVREGKKRSLYYSVLHRKKDALNYMEYIVDECNSGL